MQSYGCHRSSQSSCGPSKQLKLFCNISPEQQYGRDQGQSAIKGECSSVEDELESSFISKTVICDYSVTENFLRFIFFQTEIRKIDSHVPAWRGFLLPVHVMILW